MAEWVEGDGQRDLPPRGTGRRRSIVTLLILLTAIPVAFLASLLRDRGWVTGASERAVERAGVVYLVRSRAFLVWRGAEAPLALSALSPHLHHRLLYCPPAEAFQGDHGEVFDRLGRYVGGPSSRGMDRVPVRVREGLVQVMTGTISRGPARAVRGGDPTGPLCEVPGSEPSPGFATEPSPA